MLRLAAPVATFLVAALFALLPAAAAQPVAAAPRPSINVSDTVVTLGTTVTVHGLSPFLLQTVRLEMKTAENSWQEIDRMVSHLNRGYTFVAPSWYGTHQLRVNASATILAPASISDIRTVRVRTAYAPKGQASDWSWISDQGARWDPCSTITYRINPTGGYARSVADIRAAFRRVGSITGFHYQYAGTTTSAVRRAAGSHPPGTDVLVDWQTPGKDKTLSGTVAAHGGHWVLDGRRYDGYVVLDQSEKLAPAMWRRVMAHEVAHVVGLGHARSTTQVLHRGSTVTSVRWGAGDLSGLQRLGASRGCL